MRNVEPRKTRSRSIIGPLLLITIGTLFLLTNLGLLAWGFWGAIWQFWPVILILIGIELLFGRSRPRFGAILVVVVLVAAIGASAAMSGGFAQPFVDAPADVERIVEEVGDLRSAQVELDMGAGEITLGSLQGDSSNLVEADIATGATTGRVDKRFNTSNGEGNLRLKSEGRPSFLWGRREGNLWDVKLTQALPLTLRVKTGASRSTLDLTDLKVADLRLDVGAGTVALRMPGTGMTKAAVKAGAASVNIEIPPTMAARIHSQGGLSSFNIDEERFPRRGTYYESNNWNSATDRIELEIDAGVASVTVR